MMMDLEESSRRQLHQTDNMLSVGWMPHPGHSTYLMMIDGCWLLFFMVVRPTICCWIFFFPPPCISRNLAFDSPIDASSIKGGESNAVLHTYEEVSSSLTHISQSFKISVMSIYCVCLLLAAVVVQQQQRRRQKYGDEGAFGSFKIKIEDFWRTKSHFLPKRVCVLYPNCRTQSPTFKTQDKISSSNFLVWTQKRPNMNAPFFLPIHVPLPPPKNAKQH